MICPECKSAIVIQAPDQIGVTGAKIYLHDCSRCFAKIRIQVTILEPGDSEKIKAVRLWLNEGREG